MASSETNGLQQPSGYYVARRLSRNGAPATSASPALRALSPPLSQRASLQLGAVLTGSSPSDPTRASPSPGMTAHSPPGSAGAAGQDLSARSKEELVRIANKLGTELNIKNKVIYDLKIKEHWLLAEFMTLKKNGQLIGGSDDDQSSSIENILSKESIRASDFEDARIKLFQTLIYFKKELAKSKLVVDQYSSGINSPTDMSLIERQRIQQLETNLKTALNDISTLQSKVALWCRASKKNQESRIQAEACLRTVESEAATLRGLLAQSKETEEKQRRQIAQVEAERDELRMRGPAVQGGASSALEARAREQELVIKALEERLRAADIGIETARERIGEFETTMHDAVSTVDELEKENTQLRAQLKERETHVVQMATRLQEVEDVVDSSSRDVENAASRILAAENRAEVLNMELLEHKAARAQLELKVQQAEELHSSLRNSAISSNTVDADLVRSLQEHHSSEIQELQGRLGDAIEARSQLEKDMEETLKLCAEMQGQLSLLRAKADQSAGADPAQSVLLEQQVMELKVVVSRYQQREEEDAAALEAAEARCYDLERLSSELQNELGEARAQLLAANEDVAALSERLAAATSEIAALGDGTAVLKQALQAAQEEAARLGTMVKLLESKNLELEEEKSAALDELRKVTSDVSSAATNSDAVESLMKEIQLLKDQKKALEQQITVSEKHIIKLQTEILNIPESHTKAAPGDASGSAELRAAWDEFSATKDEWERNLPTSGS
ncbi:hypothetical protein HK405_009687 [Cladochytrium tenue]|nr:hypothetical protein HK405_009687 [Cladochytrium tenue]